VRNGGTAARIRRAAVLPPDRRTNTLGPGLGLLMILFGGCLNFAQPGSKLVLDGDPERTRGRKYHRSFSNTFRALPGERRGNRTLGKRDEYEDGGRKTRQASHGHADEPVQA